MKIQLTGLEIIALIVISIMGMAAVFSASGYLVAHDQYYLGVMILGVIPAAMLFIMACIIAITRNID